MERKTYKAALELPGDRGSFVARFAKLGPPPDFDSDITEFGAFKNGQRVVIEGWNHDQRLPVGEGHIREVADRAEAIVEGRFFLQSSVGRDHYETVKAMSAVQWSYTFNILDSTPGTWQGKRVRYLRALDVWGVSPVTRAAGLDTALLAISKSASRDRRRNADSLLGTSPAHLRATIEAMAGDDPVLLGGVLEGEVLDAEMQAIQERVARAAGCPHPTHRDVIRSAIARRHPGHSPRYIEVMTELELQGLANNRLQALEVGDRAASPNAGMVEAEIRAWARRPARRR